MGPTNSRPGPILFRVASTAVKVCAQVIFVQTDDQQGNEEYDKISRHIDIGGTKRLVGQIVSVHLDLFSPSGDGSSWTAPCGSP